MTNAEREAMVSNKYFRSQKLLDAAEAALRGVARLARRHAAPLVLRRLKLEVRAHFRRHLGVEFFLAEEGDEAAERIHGLR